MPFINAREGSAPNSVLYEADDGSKVLRSGGSRTWRSNNPGNISAKGGFASRHGAIGVASGREPYLRSPPDGIPGNNFSAMATQE